jgi:hypothetical protein
LTIISRYWKAKHNGSKYFLVYEKYNLNDSKDAINGLYLFSSDINNVDTDNIGNEKYTTKIPNTLHPISKLEMDIFKSTVGIIWAVPIQSGGYRISLSKSFFETPFITCPDYIEEKDAIEINTLSVQALNNTIITFYTVKKQYNGMEVLTGSHAAHHAQPPPNPSLKPNMDPLLN